MFTLPMFVACCWLKPRFRRVALAAIVFLQTLVFLYIGFRQPQDPTADLHLSRQRLRSLQAVDKTHPLFDSYDLIPSWQFELDHMNEYAKLNMVLDYHLELQQHQTLLKYEEDYAKQALKTGRMREEERDNSKIFQPSKGRKFPRSLACGR